MKRNHSLHAEAMNRLLFSKQTSVVRDLRETIDGQLEEVVFKHAGLENSIERKKFRRISQDTFAMLIFIRRIKFIIEILCRLKIFF